MTVFDESGSELDVTSSDVEKIKVNVEEIDTDEKCLPSRNSRRNLIVKLDKLSIEEIKKYTQNTDTSNEHKRRSDFPLHIYSMRNSTRSKRRKLDTELTSTVEVQSNLDYASGKTDKTSSTCKTKPIVELAVAVIPFKIGDVVWGKIQGWPHWPAKVTKIFPRQYEVEWFNDFRTTKLYRSQIYKFGPNFEIFADKFDSTAGLREAAEQALIFFSKRR